MWQAGWLMAHLRGGAPKASMLTRVQAGKALSGAVRQEAFQAGNNRKAADPGAWSLPLIGQDRTGLARSATGSGHINKSETMISMTTKEPIMKTLRTLSKVALIGVTLVGFAGCADMTPKQRNTAIGAGAGALGGAVLTDGSALGTLGGAAVGGVVGNVVTKDRR